MSIVTSVHLKVVRCKKKHHMIVVEGICRLGESLFLEVEMSTTGSLPLMNREVLRRPSVMPNVRIPSGKREGFQDNATRKKREVYC